MLHFIDVTLDLFFHEKIIVHILYVGKYGYLLTCPNLPVSYSFRICCVLLYLCFSLHVNFAVIQLILLSLMGEA